MGFNKAMLLAAYLFTKPLIGADMDRQMQFFNKYKNRNDMKTKKHKWRKGHLPQVCLCCGIIRDRKTFKLLMAITNSPPYNHYKYESKMVYITPEKTFKKAPSCKA